MEKATKLGAGIVTLVAALSATSAFAQDLVGGTSVAAERNEDLIEAIEDDAERDIDRFGNEGRPQGFTGSFALRGIASSGNTDSLDLGVGTDLGYVWGQNGLELNLSYAYGEDEGVKTEESMFYGLEYTRDFTPNTFGFAKVQGSVDEFSSYKTDTFASFGVGYRIFNDDTRQWSIQAGPGYRFAELNDLTSGDVDEAAFGISSDYAHKLTETLYLTMDTDVITSESDTVVFNDLALSVAVSKALALRTSVLTEYHSDPLPGFDDTDNTFGVSLVYSFN
ncbi:DUF481 domain-containing protein [Vannielia litorea]|uniref:Putative salt-induced outer membrane protein n=1 Tax=Vannielia litorea TaxID=1217970 RepID=A0A1N6HQ47_9RHOB|nr:DUF481 domain-containing protein [Vannielia litorea]SIO21836.1 putative salt-induced outer membrane protein [Vannielia litorea]